MINDFFHTFFYIFFLFLQGNYIRQSQITTKDLIAKWKNISLHVSSKNANLKEESDFLKTEEKNPLNKKFSSNFVIIFSNSLFFVKII